MSEAVFANSLRDVLRYNSSLGGDQGDTVEVGCSSEWNSNSCRIAPSSVCSLTIYMLILLILLLSTRQWRYKNEFPHSTVLQDILFKNILLILVYSKMGKEKNLMNTVFLFSLLFAASKPLSTFLLLSILFFLLCKPCSII